MNRNLTLGIVALFFGAVFGSIPKLSGDWIIWLGNTEFHISSAKSDVQAAVPIATDVPVLVDVPIQQPKVKCGFTDTMQIGEGSSFWSTGSPYWSGQYGGMHLGDDFVGNPGDPVYAPWEMSIDSVGEYTDPGRFGKNIQAHIVADGVLFYAGHLIDVYVQAGDVVPACTPIGTLGATSGPHTHIKMAGPQSPIPCEGSEPGSNGCIDPMEYWETH